MGTNTFRDSKSPIESRGSATRLAMAVQPFHCFTASPPRAIIRSSDIDRLIAQSPSPSPHDTLFRVPYKISIRQLSPLHNSLTPRIAKRPPQHREDVALE